MWFQITHLLSRSARIVACLKCNLRMSLAKLDRVIARGELKAKKHGHSVVVMASEITRYIEQWPDVQPRAVRSAR